MTAALVKGWCPNAWHPMQSGDGLLVRVKPGLGRLTRTQLLGLCEASLRYGNGLIDATSRANLQLRGVSEAGWRGLIDHLIGLGLVDPDPLTEARRNILVAPDWIADDDTTRIANDLLTRIPALPELPGKLGFAVDAGPAPILGGDPADFRIEREHDGGLILRADGHSAGTVVTAETAADGLIRLAQWFVAAGGAAAGRMRRFAAPLPDWAKGKVPPAPPRPQLIPGLHRLGMAVGFAFGRIEAHALAAMLGESSATALRLTPWRVAVVEGVGAISAPGFLTDPAAPELRSDACPGLPGCAQSTVETRELASRLAPFVKGRLHVSGCAKGCARAKPAAVMLTGRNACFDLAFGARAGAPPERAGLTAAQVLAHFGAE
jgi:precorrin-3B synthase